MRSGNGNGDGHDDGRSVRVLGFAIRWWVSIGADECVDVTGRRNEDRDCGGCHAAESVVAHAYKPKARHALPYIAVLGDDLSGIG